MGRARTDSSPAQAADALASVPDSGARTPLRELAFLFLRLGATAFGGPAAHIAMMRDEVVRRRGWLSEAQFLDLLGATNLIPGPNSTEMAIHVGWARRRWKGLLVAGVAFILPAVLLTSALGWVYTTYGSVPQVTWLLWGIKPVILSIVLQAAWGLARKAARTWLLALVGVAAVAAALLGVNELVVLFGAGAILVAVRAPRTARPSELGVLLPVLPVAGASSAVAAITLPGIFWVFLKTGSVLFGSGYVLLAFLHADLVERLQWLSEPELMDAIAIGQVTPGPVFTTATFVGYLLAGPAGALVATLGIFLPAFVFVALSGPLVPRMRASRLAGGFLDGVNVASLALMGVVSLDLARAAVVDAFTASLALAALLLLLRYKLNSAWLVLGGAVSGALVHLARIQG